MIAHVETRSTATRVGEQAVGFFSSVVQQLNSALNRSEVKEFRISLEHSCEQMKIANAANFITVRYCLELTLRICHSLGMSNSMTLIAYIKNNVFYEYYRSQTPLTA